MQRSLSRTLQNTWLRHMLYSTASSTQFNHITWRYRCLTILVSLSSMLIKWLKSLARSSGRRQTMYRYLGARAYSRDGERRVTPFTGSTCFKELVTSSSWDLWEGLCTREQQSFYSSVVASKSRLLRETSRLASGRKQHKRRHLLLKNDEYEYGFQLIKLNETQIIEWWFAFILLLF